MIIDLKYVVKIWRCFKMLAKYSVTVEYSQVLV